MARIVRGALAALAALVLCASVALASEADVFFYNPVTGKWGAVTSSNPLPVNATVTATATTTATASSAPTTVSPGTGIPLNVDLHSALFSQLTFAGTPVDGTHGLPTNCIAGCAGGTASNASSGVATSSTNGTTNAWLYGFNGTTYDQLQVDGSKNLKVTIIAPSGALAAGAGADGWNVTEGTKADSAYAGSGSASVIALLKGLYSGITSSIPSGTNPIGTINPTTAANWGVGATGSATPANAVSNGVDAQSAEPAKATTGNLTSLYGDLVGKAVTSPYANRENMVRGSASATGTGATTLIAAGGASVKTYITDVECGRSDAGTSAIIVTFSDAAATILVLPNSGGGGGNNKTFNVPLVTAANTAFTFTAGTGATTVYCSAQGFSGY